MNVKQMFKHCKNSFCPEICRTYPNFINKKTSYDVLLLWIFLAHPVSNVLKMCSPKMDKIDLYQMCSKCAAQKWTKSTWRLQIFIEQIFSEIWNLYLHFTAVCK